MNVAPPPSPSLPPTPPPVYRRHEPMVTLLRNVGEGRLPSTQDAWERPPARRTCWQVCCEDPCDPEADSNSWCALVAARFRSIASTCCILLFGD